VLQGLGMLNLWLSLYQSSDKLEELIISTDQYREFMELCSIMAFKQNVNVIMYS
jgi:hypothetical protein